MTCAVWVVRWDGSDDGLVTTERLVEGLSMRAAMAEARRRAGRRARFVSRGPDACSYVDDRPGGDTYYVIR